MEQTIVKVGVVGYGNLGKAVTEALQAAEDAAQPLRLHPVGVFTRRDPKELAPGGCLSDGFPLRRFSELLLPQGLPLREKPELLLLCGGSQEDLPSWSPALAGSYCLLDSYDLHGDLPRHKKAVDAAAKAGGHLALVGCGWDPGLLSIGRIYGNALFPEGVQTGWGPGISQGHSEALRRLPGVVDAVQQTVPVEENGRLRHRRVCYICPAEDADFDAIVAAAKSLPGYFEGYESEWHCCTVETVNAVRGSLPHAGRLLAEDGEATARLELTMRSNPRFTARVLLAAAAALWQRYRDGQIGCLTVDDLPPCAWLSDSLRFV